MKCELRFWAAILALLGIAFGTLAITLHLMFPDTITIEHPRALGFLIVAYGFIAWAMLSWRNKSLEVNK